MFKTQAWLKFTQKNKTEAHKTVKKNNKKQLNISKGDTRGVEHENNKSTMKRV